MAEFFIELFSEEIPARMQKAAAQELLDICSRAFFGLEPEGFKFFYGPRRIALTVQIKDQKAGSIAESRGPREDAAEAAFNGYLSKFPGVIRKDLILRDGYYWLCRTLPAVPAFELISTVLAPALAKFSWPKSMRWGQSGDFAWVRPLRRMVCLLDGTVVPIKLGPVTASNETEGHRFMAPGAFVVTSAANWQAKLRERKVIADPAERRALVVEGLMAVATTAGLTVVEDAGLVDEVTGLVEWPVALLGRIDSDFMDLPPEVRELSMKLNQRYFALRDDRGKPAPYFVFAANIAAADGGKAIIAGNERVLRARLSDARHFWDMDLKTPLSEFLPKLAKITFHAKIGTQLQRSERLQSLAIEIADALDANGFESVQAGQAALLCKADLVTGMVGEFPELQGIMGGYYAERHQLGWDGSIVGPAIKSHYQPKGPSDTVPSGIVAVSVALADKLDTLIQFFAIGETPTGSGDPYALRRAALGVIRIILENELALPLRTFISNGVLFDFIIERLRVKLRSEGQRYDVLDAVLATGDDDDLVRLMRRVNAVAALLGSEDGRNLLIAYRRAANILRIEDAKDGPHKAGHAMVANALPEEAKLNAVLAQLADKTVADFHAGAFDNAMAAFAQLRAPVDAFFDKVTVNDPVPQIRLNRLQLLAQLRDTMHQIADFSKIEG